MISLKTKKKIYDICLNKKVMANKNVIWCDKKTLEKNLNGGKVYIITGASSGVG